MNLFDNYYIIRIGEFALIVHKYIIVYLHCIFVLMTIITTNLQIV